jgi:pimeloyl-ACP methyl ester carboxylesterase
VKAGSSQPQASGFGPSPHSCASDGDKVSKFLVSLPPILLALALSACVHRGPTVDPARMALYVRQITLYDHPLEVHFARPRQILPLRPMLLYATGDGGFHGNDRAIFDALASFGYPVAGFSARNYLKNLGYVADTTTPQRLAIDYRRLIEFSEKSLELPPNTPVILVGVSRGAGLAVVAAGQRMVRNGLAGVLAIALTKEEEYVRHYRVRPGRTPPGMPRRELVMIETYEYLPRLSSLRVSVIQSTRDNYLPADEARQLFGPDTADRQLHPIKAWDHSFAGARDELYARMEQSLDWISSVLVPALPAVGR